jgi:hypothetical protein
MIPVQPVPTPTTSDATAPVSWYVPHILGCLVALAARLTLAELPRPRPPFGVSSSHRLELP